MSKLLIICFSVLIVFGCSSTQTKIQKANLDPKTYEKADVDNSAGAILMMHPKYPVSAKNENIEGWVKAFVYVNEEGRVSKVEIIDSTPQGIFEESATNALKKWLYNPAIKNGKTVKVRHVEIVDFKI